MQPTLHRPEGGRPVLVWRAATPWRAISSAVLGGGIGLRHWVLNATVPAGYDRPDPDAHLAEIAEDLGLSGPGVGLMTAVDVVERVTAADRGVLVVATVGLSQPEWAAAPDVPPARPHAGTVNMVAFLPVLLAEAALVNAVATVTEAKAQALWELGLEGTGTASDAICILCPPDGPAARYGGPRSTWGARLARAAHAALTTGASSAQAPDLPQRRVEAPGGAAVQ